MEKGRPIQSNTHLTIRRGSLYRTILLAFMLGIVAAAFVVAIYFNVLGKGRVMSGEELEYYEDLDQRFGKFYTMEDTIRSKSLYDTTDEDIDADIANAILRMADDGYAAYYTPEEYAAFERKYLNSYSGIGIAYEIKDGKVTVSRVIEGGPADDAGIEAGDVITKIDGEVPGTMEETQEMLGGETGSKVVLTIERKGKTKDYTVYRNEIEDKSVTSEIYNKRDKVAMVKISTFREGTSDELSDAIKGLKTEGYDKFIIDVRGNTGGVTTEGIDSADLLLPACKIITVKNNSGNEEVYNSDETTLDIKYVVLVDGDTGSAAEIFAGAIKDNGGGKLIGTKTYGKGLIQTLFRLRDDSYFKITTEEYILPSGSINEKGIEPDIKVGKGEDAAEIALSELTG